MLTLWRDSEKGKQGKHRATIAWCEGKNRSRCQGKDSRRQVIDNGLLFTHVFSSLNRFSCPVEPYPDSVAQETSLG